jgi:hypothetical protein
MLTTILSHSQISHTADYIFAFVLATDSRVPAQRERHLEGQVASGSGGGGGLCVAHASEDIQEWWSSCLGGEQHTRGGIVPGPCLRAGTRTTLSLGVLPPFPAAAAPPLSVLSPLPYTRPYSPTTPRCLPPLCSQQHLWVSSRTCPTLSSAPPLPNTRNLPTIFTHLSNCHHRMHYCSNEDNN